MIAQVCVAERVRATEMRSCSDSPPTSIPSATDSEAPRLPAVRSSRTVASAADRQRQAAMSKMGWVPVWSTRKSRPWGDRQTKTPLDTCLTCHLVWVLIRWLRRTIGPRLSSAVWPGGLGSRLSRFSSGLRTTRTRRRVGRRARGVRPGSSRPRMGRRTRTTCPEHRGSQQQQHRHDGEPQPHR